MNLPVCQVYLPRAQSKLQSGLLQVQVLIPHHLFSPDARIQLSIDGRLFRPAPSFERHRDGDNIIYTLVINTLLLDNGAHQLKIEYCGNTDQVVCQAGRSLEVLNKGALADQVKVVLEKHCSQTVVFDQPLKTVFFPYAASKTIAWFERENASENVSVIANKHGLNEDEASRLGDWVQNGYTVLPKLIPAGLIDSVNKDLDDLLSSGTIQYLEGGGTRLEHAHKHSAAVRRLWCFPAVMRMLDAIFDDEAAPCQTLNFIFGSQQSVHQDTIHLTSFPAGYMCGVWVGLEDIHSDAGPLCVYPGSHRLERVYAETVGMQKVSYRDEGLYDRKYLPVLLKQLADGGYKCETYLLKKGDVLIWHENLAHGGLPRKDDKRTRRSMVSHYFAQGALAFYDSTGKAANQDRDVRALVAGEWPLNDPKNSSAEAVSQGAFS